MRVLAADCLKMPRGEAFQQALASGDFKNCTFIQTIYDTSKALGQALDTLEQVKQLYHSTRACDVYATYSYVCAALGHRWLKSCFGGRRGLSLR